MIERCEGCRKWRTKYGDLLVEKVRLELALQHMSEDADEERLSLHESERMSNELERLQAQIKELNERLATEILMRVAAEVDSKRKK